MNSRDSTFHQRRCPISHIAEVELEIKDLDALEAACRRVGLELVRGQKTYRWFGLSVGDYPLPEGFTAEELGKCEHAVRVPGNPNAYEIGVVPRRDGRAGYSLMWDFYAGGRGLQVVAGEGCNKLRQAYATEVATRQARRQGFRVHEQKQADGSVRLVMSR